MRAFFGSTQIDSTQITVTIITATSWIVRFIAVKFFEKEGVWDTHNGWGRELVDSIKATHVELTSCSRFKTEILAA